MDWRCSSSRRSRARQAQPELPSWPTPADVRSYTPGLGADDAACVARYYRGRLSRKAWLTPYFKLTPAQKAVTDAGFDHCQTKAQRIALIERQEAIYFGKHPADACVARAMDARTRAQRIALTSLARQIREDDKVFRRCGLIGQLYATLGKATKLILTPAEQRCVNRVGIGRSRSPSCEGAHDGRAQGRRSRVRPLRGPRDRGSDVAGPARDVQARECDSVHRPALREHHVRDLLLRRDGPRAPGQGGGRRLPRDEVGGPVSAPPRAPGRARAGRSARPPRRSARALRGLPRPPCAAAPAVVPGVWPRVPPTPPRGGGTSRP